MNDLLAELGKPLAVSDVSSSTSLKAPESDLLAELGEPLAVTTDSDDPEERFSAKMADPKERARLQKFAEGLGTTIDDPAFQERVKSPMGLRTYSTLNQMATTGDVDEGTVDEQGRPEGLGVKALLMQFGHAGGMFRRRDDALISRLAAGQEMEVIATDMAGAPSPNIRVFKKIEDMTREEQDATIPKQILDVVSQYDTPEAPMDAKSRAQAIYDVAKTGAQSREQMRQLAAEELAIREEITGKSDGILNTLGTLAAKGMPTVGYGTSFLVGGAPLGAVVAGMDKTSELLSADIDPETGKVLKAGEGYDAARVKGYGYGAFEALSEQFTGKLLGLAFKGLDKITGGYMGKAVSKGADALADTMAKTKIGRGIADLMKGVQRVAGLSYLENPAVEAGEEGIQQWSEKVFARRTSDTETPIYVKNVLNEATGQLEAVPVEPGSDEEETARRQIALYGEKSPYAQAGTRQQTVGEKTQQFNDKFFTWDNMGELAEGFALQYALTLGGGALHAVQSKEARGVVNRALLAAGATNADLIRMSDEQKAEAFDKYYGSEANRAEFAEVFKDAGEKLADMAQRMQDVDTWTRTGNSLKPNVGVDLAKELATGTLTVDDEKSGLSADQKVTPDGTEITVRDRDGLLQPVTVGNAAEAQKAMERMSQLKQGREADMNSRAQIAQNVANAFAPGRRLVLVHNSADMLAAAKGEYADEGKTFDEAGFKGDAKGLTTPRGTLIVNVAAATGFDDLVATIKHETGHSVADEAGLTKLMAGKTVAGIAAEFQKAGIIAPGAGGLEKFVKAVESVRAQYAARGVKLADADAVAEVLSMQQERMTPLFRKKFGDGLVTLLRGKDKSAKNMRDVRRAVALIMYSGREAKVDLYGGPDAWKAPAPAFTGDPIAAAGTETGEKEAVEPAEEAAPEAMPAQGEEAPGAEAVPPVAAPEAKPPAAPSPEAKAAAKEIKAAFEQKLKAEAPPVEEGAATPPAEETAGASIPVMITKKMEADLRAGRVSQADIDKMTPQQAHDRLAKLAKRSASEAKAKTETAPTETDIEIAPNPEPAQSDKPAIAATSDAGRGEAPAVPLDLEGGTPAEIEAEKAKVEAQRKKQEERDEIAKKAAAPLKGDLGDSTPPLPGMEGVAPDDLELLNQKPKEVQNADQERGAEKVAGGKQARGAEADGGGDAQGSKATGTAGKPEGEGLQERAVALAPTVAKMSAEVTFESVPKKGQYAEIPGVSTAQGKRMYLIQGKWGNGNTFHVSPTHHGIVLTGMGVLLRTKGNPSAHSGVRIVGGGKVPEGSEKWGVAEWATHNQKLSNRHKEGAKPAVPTASDSAPTAEAKPVEAPKTETPKAEPPAPAEPPVAPAKPKRKFADLDALAGYMADHPEETVEWTEEDYEIEAGEAVPAQAAPESVSPAVEAPTAPIFEPRQRRLGEPKFKYDQAIKADRAAWEAEQAGKAKPEITTAAIAQAEATTATPTEGQRDAGNYRKGRFTVHGFEIAIENPKGSVRSGVAKDGTAWRTTMKNTYGYFAGESDGKDGDKLDVFLGPDVENASMVYVVDQIEPATGVFDEHKVMLGFTRKTEAARAYLSNYQPGWKGLKNITGVPLATFKAWMASSDRKMKPFAEYKAIQLAQKDVAPFEVEGLRFNGIQRIEGMPDQVVWTDEETNGTFYMPADATAEQTAAHRDESRKTFKAAASGAKDAEEIAEVRNNAETSARVDAIPDEIYDDNPALAVMNVELPAYAKRKATSTRTADSMERQAYSTPPPLAAIGAAAVAGAGSDTDAGVTVIEPTAGNGGLLAVLQLAENDRVLANELDKGRAARLRELFPDGRFTVTQGDYADTNYQDAVETAGRAGPRAFLMNPPFGRIDESGLKLEHRVALKTIASARPGDTMFFIGAAPGRDAMKMQSGALAGAYTAGAFAKFHSRLNEQGWKPMLHFIADGALYKKMGAAFPVEVLLMEKTSGVTPDLHRPMRDLPARYATWEQIRAAVAEMYNPGALALTERVAASLSATPEREKEAREEANLNASTSAEEPNAAREKEGTDPETGAPRYRLSQDVELGLVTPDTDLTPNPAMLKIFGRVWDKEFAGKAFNPDQLARAILDLPDETAEARIKTADAIARYLQANPANRFVISGDYISMGSVLRDIFRARWNAERVSTVESAGDRGQIPYESLSSVETATPMKIPVDLATGVMTALDNFAERHPEGIDAYVAEKMRWTPEQERDGRLDGSQIDALGMAIEKIDEGTGFIVGSQTGAGKGRIMASVMDYHAKQGRVPIFITAQAKLFTDIWRDIVAVGAKDRIKPLVFNEYKAPKTDTDTNSDEADENAFVMPQFFGSAQRSAALADSKLPTGATAVFLTYSQVQNPSESTRRKVQFIANLLTSGRGALVLDEAHLAAGADSARGAVLRNFASMSKPGVVFSSATFAKRGENMTLYKRAGYSAFFKDDEEMDKALSFGGVPFQQYLAARLTERAFYIRHELDYEGVIFDKMETTDTLGTPQERTALSQREEQIADVYNQVIRTVLRFNNAVKLANSRLQKGAPGAHMDGEAFMSSLHNTASFIYTALKAGTVANAAVQELRNGRAPVITLYNTNQALLTEIGINERADVGRYLMRIAEKATSVQMPDGTSAPILSPQGHAYLTSVLKEEQADMLINAADALMGQANSAADYLREQDLPASPIDRVREIVETAGFKFAELTGRSYMVQNGTISHRLKPNPDTVVNAFNNSLGADGKPDTVLLLNSSAAAGLSIHAHPGFKNHAPRVMFVLQPAWDINEMMQIFGRVNRKNQLTKPVYHLMFTSAAGEQRNAAILMKKLRSLSANTSGVSKAGYGETAEDSLDFMNAFGDKALAELEKEQNPVVATINQLRVSDTIRRATAISQFLSVREQELFISEIQKKVAALQEHARESGTHELEAGDVGRVPLTNEQLGAGNTMRAYEVPVMGRATVLTAGEAIERAKAWQAKNGALLEQASEKIKEADKATQNPWLRRNYEMTRRALSDAVESIGRVLTVQDDAGRRMFIPIELWLPPSGAAQVASDWRVKVSFNNIRGVTTIPLTIYGERLLAKAQGGYDYIYNNTLTRKEMRTLVTGDIAKALIGNIVVVGAEGVGITQIVRATPKDGNFSSFVLMMPRGITVAEAKRIVSSRLVKLTDIRDLHGHTDQYGRLEIDSARIIVRPSYSSATGAVNGGMFGFRLATPKRAQSKDISIAQIMRAAGSESRLSDDPDARGYVNSPFLDIEEANMALAALSKLHPALTAHIVVTDEAKVGEQDAVARNAPRFRLPGVKLDAAAEPVFFSQLRRTLEAKMPNRMTVMALRGMIDPSRSGVKADEIEWTGLKDFLDSKNPGDYVTKAEVLEAVRDVEIQEVVKGQTQAELESQEELTVLARLGRDRTPEQDARYEQLARRSRIGKDLDNATKFEQYQLAGGKNYRELLLTLPEDSERWRAEYNAAWDAKEAAEKAFFANPSAATMAVADAARAKEYELSRNPPKNVNFKSSHFSEPNILAHVRFNERQAANGDKTLFLEEVQSDWHQKGREEGYAGRRVTALPAEYSVVAMPDSDGQERYAVMKEGNIYGFRANTREAAVESALKELNGGSNMPGAVVPDAPFKDTSKGWARLAFKRMLRWAAENGFDRIAWTTGEQQAERYDLSKKIERVSYNDLTGQLMAWEVGTFGDPRRLPVLRETVPIEKSADYVGKEAAQKLIAATPVNDVRSISGDDLRVGGEGMRTFYDKILPSIANDLGKKFGARVEDVDVGGRPNTMRVVIPLPSGGYGVQDRGSNMYFTATPESWSRDIEKAKSYPTSREAMGGFKSISVAVDAVTVHSLPVTPAMRDSVMQGQPRFRLPGVTLDGGISAPVRVGALRSQVDLENSSPVPFPILSHLRGGSKLVIPYDFRGGEYDWFTENGGFTAFPLAEQQAFFTRPAITERRTRGNIDTLAQEMNFDNTEEFAMAFLAEVERSRALYADEIARQGIRRGTLNAARRKFARIRNKEDVGAVMGRAVAAVAHSLPEDIQGDMARIGETEGEEGVRHFILSRYFEHVLLEMADTYSLAGRDDTLPEEIQDEGTFARPETVNKEGATAPTFQQTKARLAALAATLGAQPLEGVPTVTDEAAAAYVQDIEKTEGQVFLADLAKRLIAERLAGQRETPLTKYEAAVMLRYQTILDARTLATDRAANDAAAENNTAELKMIDNERDQIHADTVEYLDTMRKYGSAAGQALQALKLRVDHGFNIVKIYTQAIEDNGGIALAPAQYTALRDRVLRLEKAWADYMDAVGAPDEADELEARIAELEKQIGEMTAARDTAQKDVDSLGAKRAELAARHAGVAQSAGELSEKRARLQSEIARLESEISFRTGLSQQVEELQAKVDDLMVKMAALDAEYAGIDMNALAEIEAQLADLEAQYRTKQIEYERAAEALKTAVARRARMRKLLEKLSKSTKGKIERRREVQQEASNLYGVFKAEMEKAQLERLAARWRGATPLGKLWLGIGVTRNVIRALQSMGDESVAGRQLAKLGLGHPVLWARAFAQSQKIMFSLAGPVDEKGRLLTLRERSDRALFEEDQLIREHPLWAVLRKAGLDWIDLTADPTSLDEQQIPVSALLRANLPRWTGVGGVTTMLDVSNNHYAAMSNMLRFAVAAQLYEKMQIANGGLPLSEADVRDIVSTVDIFGGRGSITTEKTRSFINLASAILYSPRLAAANVQFYARALGFLNPAHSWRAKKLIASEYMRTLGMYAALSVVARLISEAFSDDPDEQRFQFNWGHPAFLQFVFGQNRVDVSGGAALWARYAGSISGQSSRVSTESGMVMGERSGFDANAFIRLIRSKLDPWSGMILDVAMGKTYSGQAAGPFAEPHQPGYKLRYANMLTSINPTPLLVQTLTDLVSGSPEEGIQPLRNPLVLFPVVSLEMLGVLGSSLPINSDLAQQVESGNTWAAKRLEKLRRKQRDILGDKKMRPEIKEIKAEQIQRQLDQIRGI